MRWILVALVVGLAACGEDGGGGPDGCDTGICVACEPGETRCGTRWHSSGGGVSEWLQTCGEDGVWRGGYESCVGPGLASYCDDQDGPAHCVTDDGT
jgi:hypothetical protein